MVESFSGRSAYPWPWLASPAAAEDMAKEVAAWPEKYGCDGIDLVRMMMMMMMMMMMTTNHYRGPQLGQKPAQPVDTTTDRWTS
jgi:hypothetical protein